jgi:alanine racemase
VRNFVVNNIPDDVSNVVDANFLVVDDTLKALQKVGAFRSGFNGKIVAITGSRGKTTLKEWIFQLVEPFKEVVRSPRSYNSQIGVPLSLWEIESDTELAIIEAGISRKGEMTKLAEMIRPDVAIFTNIGDEHSDGFASIEEKCAEKTLILSATEHTSVIYSLDDRLISDAIGKYADKIKTFTYSRCNPKADILISEVVATFEGNTEIHYIYRGEEKKIKLNFLADKKDVDNAAEALAFMLMDGYEDSVVSERFATLRPVGTRLNVSEGVNGCSVIYDSYTSDYGSLLPAVDFMKRRLDAPRTSVIILSDLRHRSVGENELYHRIADLVKVMGINRFIGVGEALYRHKDIFEGNVSFFKTTDDLMQTLSPSDFADEMILVKGAPEYGFEAVAQMLEAKTHETVLEVNLDSVAKNYNYFKSRLKPETGLVAMVKASGYGAGSYEIAKTMQDCGAAYLAVAVIDEGVELRRRGIKMPIMVMNPKVVNYKTMFANRLEPEIYSIEMLKDVINEARKNGIKHYPVHLKLDTGMHRTGFIEEELADVMDILSSQDCVEPRSVFSHLATADCPDMDEYTLMQLERYDKWTNYMLSRWEKPILRHVLNSAGILRFPKYQYDMARLGIGLYGANTLPPEIEKPLECVSTLRTMIISLRDRLPGESIGYSRKTILTRPSKIATIPIGYADGMNRHFGCGRISVMVNGKEAPTVGNICMDACMIDVTDIDCNVGDPVEIFGKSIPLQRLADVLETIPYEILTSVSPRVKRVYYRE